MWMGGVDRVLRITPTGDFTEFPTPTFQLPVSDIAVGADGNIWIAQSDLPVTGVIGTVARVTPAGQVTEFPLSERETWPLSIAAGPGEHLAFSEGSSVGWVDMDGTITRFRLGSGNQAEAVAYGHDGNVWFTETGGRIGRLTSNGQVTEYSIPGAPYEAGDIALGSDGNLWFTVPEKGAVGRITTSGRIRLFPVYDTGNPGEMKPAPRNIAPGGDGRLWFSESRTGSLGWINPVHLVVGRFRFPPKGETYPVRIAPGPEGTLWYSALTGNFEGGGGTQMMNKKPPKIGRIALEPLAVKLGTVHVMAGFRRARTRLACKGGKARDICRGVLRLRVKAHGPDGAASWLTLSERRYAIPTDRTRKVTLDFDSQTRSLVSRRHPRLRIQAIATSGRGDGDEIVLRSVGDRPAEPGSSQ